MRTTIMKHALRHQAGDTIIEVIIAVSVVSVLLLGAFTVTNRSARSVRDSEEHAQAIQLLQGQVELLRQAAIKPSAITAPIDKANAFCLDSSGTRYASAATQCLITSTFGGGATLGYRLAIWSSDIPAPALCTLLSCTTTTFQLTATWPSLNSGTNTVYLTYRVAVL